MRSGGSCSTIRRSATPSRSRCGRRPRRRSTGSRPMTAVRVVVLSGAGDKAFVSGADISKFESERAGAEAVAHYNATTARLLSEAHGLPQADDRRDHRQLRRRRRGARGVLRPADLRRRARASRSRPRSSGSATASPGSSGWSTWSARRSPRRCSSPRGCSRRPRPTRCASSTACCRTHEVAAYVEGYAQAITRQRAAHDRLGQGDRRRGAEGPGGARPRALRRAGRRSASRARTTSRAAAPSSRSARRSSPAPERAPGCGWPRSPPLR